MCVCVCVEGEREERECVCVCVEGEREERESVCVCVDDNYCSYIFCPMVEFSWNRRSTSTSKLLA